jgi:hypothetical protein
VSGVDCPPWCTYTHRPDRPPWFHDGVLAGFGRSGCEAQIAVEQFTREGLPEEPALRLWAIALDGGPGESRSMSLSAGDARALADVLAKVPPGELADFVRALNDAAALLDDADATAHPTDNEAKEQG